MLFRKGKKPMWEEFLEGGTWIIHFKKREYDILNKKWEALLMGKRGVWWGEVYYESIYLSLTLSACVGE